MRWPKQQEVKDGISAVLSFATPSSRLSQLASIQKSKERVERGRIGTTSMKTRVNLCVYFFNLRFHESRVERMPGYVSIQTYTPTLILVIYATTAEWLESNTEPIIKYPWNTPYRPTNAQKEVVKVSLILRCGSLFSHARHSS